MDTEKAPANLAHRRCVPDTHFHTLFFAAFCSQERAAFRRGASADSDSRTSFFERLLLDGSYPGRLLLSR